MNTYNLANDFALKIKRSVILKFMKDNNIDSINIVYNKNEDSIDLLINENNNTHNNEFKFPKKEKAEIEIRNKFSNVYN